jgi:hypothetical protein
MEAAEFVCAENLVESEDDNLLEYYAVWSLWSIPPFQRCVLPPPSGLFYLKRRCTQALGKTSIAVRQWTAKQLWVDRQAFKQEDNIYYLEKVQIN